MKSSAKKQQIDETHKTLTDKLVAAAKEYQSTDKAAKRFMEVQRFFDSLEGSKPHPGVKIDEIDLSQNDRVIDLKSESFNALVESIKIQGLLQRPILTLGVSIDKPFLCVAGHRRILAYKQLEHKVVPAELILSKSESQIRLARLAENVVRQNLEPLELAEAVKRLKSQLSENIQGVARVLDKNRNYITRLLKIANWPEEAKNIAKENSLNQKQLISIAMKKLSDEEVIFELKKISGKINATPCSGMRITYPNLSKTNEKKIQSYFKEFEVDAMTQDKIMRFLSHMNIKGWKPDIDHLNGRTIKGP